jgi:hypothetical protein
VRGFGVGASIIHVNNDDNNIYNDNENNKSDSANNANGALSDSIVMSSRMCTV